MIRFGAPHFLPWLALVPGLAGFVAWSWRQRRRALARFAAPELAARLTAGISRPRQKLKEALLVLAVGLALLALARPQWGYRWEETKRRGVDVMIVVDVSRSMLAGDVSPSRLERARRKIVDWLRLAQGDRIGLIGFAGRAFVLTPLTLDYGALQLFVDALDPELIPVPGTAVAEALSLATRAMQKGSPGSRAILLLSDGEDLAGEAEAAARRAAKAGIQIDTLGIGSPEGAPIPEPGGGFKKDAEGKLVLTRLDEGILQKLAQATGGSYVKSVAGDQDLEAIYRHIQGGLEEKELKSGRRRIFLDRYQWFLAAAVGLWLIVLFLPERRRERNRAWRLTGWLVVGLLGLATPGWALGTAGLVRAGERHYAAGRYQQAVEKFLAAQLERPDDPRITYNLASAYYQLGRYDEARRLFQALGEKTAAGLQERSIYNQGNAAYRQRDLDGAIAAYEKALELDPHDEGARYNLEFVKRQKEPPKEPEKQDQEKQTEKKQDQEKQAEKKPAQEKQPPRKQEPAKSEQRKTDPAKSGEPKPEPPPAAPEPQKGRLSPEEASRYLSTVHEGQRRAYQPGAQSEGRHTTEKDW